MARSQQVQEKKSPLGLTEQENFSPEMEIPEVFNLPPLTRKRLAVTVRATRPAPFHYMADDYYSEETD